MNWKVSAICSTLGCSRGWFYKWLKRYNEHDATWFQAESRAPNNIPNKIDPALEQMIVQTRKELRASPYSQYGPQAIYFAMAQKGYTPPPIWTIARTLNRYGLVEHKQKGKYVSKGKTYS